MILKCRDGASANAASGLSGCTGRAAYYGDTSFLDSLRNVKPKNSAAAAAWAIFASIQRPPRTRPFATRGNLEPLKWC